jgi:serine/threonine protein kinase
VLQSGQMLGNYEVIEQIGQGGFAWVYRMEHTVLGSQHALKVLRPELVADKQIRHRFLSEARITANLRHPNIIRATDAIAVPGVAGIVMDFIEGGSLERYIAAASAPAPPERIREVFLPVLDALHYAHASGIIHRDIKPANILMETLPDGRLRPMLVDFGVARVRGELAARQAHTQVGTRIGTVGYMSPEQLETATAADVRSDIFSLGVTMFELATLMPPFQGTTQFEVMTAISTGSYTMPEALRQADPSLARVIARALEHRPADRFSDCAEMADALRTPAPPPPVLSRTPPPAPLTAVTPPPLPPVAPPPLPELPPDTDLHVLTLNAPARGTLTYRPGSVDAQDIPLSGHDMIIGRARECDICLPRDSWVARRHCRIFFRDGQWWIRDHGTTNGTLVDGQLVFKQALSGGETITIGQTPFRFAVLAQ